MVGTLVLTPGCYQGLCRRKSNRSGPPNHINALRGSRWRLRRWLRCSPAIVRIQPLPLPVFLHKHPSWRWHRDASRQRRLTPYRQRSQPGPNRKMAVTIPSAGKTKAKVPLRRRPMTNQPLAMPAPRRRSPDRARPPRPANCSPRRATVRAGSIRGMNRSARRRSETGSRRGRLARRRAGEAATSAARSPRQRRRRTPPDRCRQAVPPR